MLSRILNWQKRILPSVPLLLLHAPQFPVFEVSQAALYNPQVILLTGASRGIGRSIAEYLLSSPSQHRLVVTARTGGPLLQLANKYPSQVAILKGDHSDPAIGQEAVKLAVSKFQQLDGVVVNHATPEPVMRLADSNSHEWRNAYDVNFFSAVSILQTALPQLRMSRGRVVLVSSTTSVTPFRSLGAYGSTKAALNHLAAVLHEEEEAITAVAIRPGEVDTELQRNLREKYAACGMMPSADAAKFHALKHNGGLLPPSVPARVIGELVLNASRDVGGRVFRWDDEILSPFVEREAIQTSSNNTICR
ncbi:hypothetical protein BST61_g4383 [Cercospora zeina]